MKCRQDIFKLRGPPKDHEVQKKIRNILHNIILKDLWIWHTICCLMTQRIMNIIFFDA